MLRSFGRNGSPTAVDTKSGGNSKRRKPRMSVNCVSINRKNFDWPWNFRCRIDTFCKCRDPLGRSASHEQFYVPWSRNSHQDRVADWYYYPNCTCFRQRRNSLQKKFDKTFPRENFPSRDAKQFFFFSPYFHYLYNVVCNLLQSTMSVKH